MQHVKLQNRPSPGNGHQHQRLTISQTQTRVARLIYLFPMRRLFPALLLFSLLPLCFAQQNRGYYRFPAIHGNVIAFTSEGDLWESTIDGGIARRLTTHPGEEAYPAFSPDGKTIAFSANYEGPTEIYTIPAAGAFPTPPPL